VRGGGWAGREVGERRDRRSVLRARYYSRFRGIHLPRDKRKQSMRKIGARKKSADPGGGGRGELRGGVHGQGLMAFIPNHTGGKTAVGVQSTAYAKKGGKTGKVAPQAISRGSLCDQSFK